MGLKRYRRKLKNLVRRNADTLVRVNRVATAVGATAAAFIPVVGLVAAPVAAAAGAAGGRYLGAMSARADGSSGHSARQHGRNEMLRTGLYGAAGAALGIGVSAAVGAGSFGTTAPAGVNGLPAGFGGVTPAQSAQASAAFGFQAAPSTLPAGFGGTTAAEAAAAATAFGVKTPIAASAFPTVTTLASPAPAGGSGGLLGTLGTAGGSVLTAVAPTLQKVLMPVPGMGPGTEGTVENPGGLLGGSGGGGDTPGGSAGFGINAPRPGEDAKGGGGFGMAAAILVGLLLLGG